MLLAVGLGLLRGHGFLCLDLGPRDYPSHAQFDCHFGSQLRRDIAILQRLRQRLTLTRDVGA